MGEARHFKLSKHVDHGECCGYGW